MIGQTCCLDIGEGYIKVVDAEASKKNIMIHSAGFSDIAFNPYAVMAKDYAMKASETIRKLIADSGIKKTDVRIVIPDSQSYTRVLDMPYLSDKELISAIRYQADQFIPVPIDQVTLDIHIIMKDKKLNKTTILLVAAAHAIVNHAVKLAEDAALVPVQLENETSAFLRLVTTMHTLQKVEKPTNKLYINFGTSTTSLYLFDAVRNVPLQVHSFSLGQQIFFKDMKANYMLSDEQIRDIIERVGFTSAQTQYKLNELFASPMNECVAEIKRFMVSAKEQLAVDVHEMYLLGEGSHFAGFDAKLTEMLGIPVKIFPLTQQLESNTVSEFFKDDWPLLASAVGGCL